jgi:hypothetical protein
MATTRQSHDLPVQLSPKATSQFSRVESFAPILQEPIWQQDREIEAPFGEARIVLAYERARSVVKAIGKRGYNILEVEPTLTATFLQE